MLDIAEESKPEGSEHYLAEDRAFSMCHEETMKGNPRQKVQLFMMSCSESEHDITWGHGSQSQTEYGV